MTVDLSWMIVFRPEFGSHSYTSRVNSPPPEKEKSHVSVQSVSTNARKLFRVSFDQVNPFGNILIFRFSSTHVSQIQITTKKLPDVTSWVCWSRDVFMSRVRHLTPSSCHLLKISRVFQNHMFYLQGHVELNLISTHPTGLEIAGSLTVVPSSGDVVLYGCALPEPKVKGKANRKSQSGDRKSMGSGTCESQGATRGMGMRACECVRSRGVCVCVCGPGECVSVCVWTRGVRVCEVCVRTRGVCVCGCGPVQCVCVSVCVD